MRWRGDRKETEKLMCDLASPLKLSYLDVIIYMAGKMAKNMLFIVLNYFVLKGFFKTINRVCFDDFAVKRIIEFRSLKKIKKNVWRLFHSIRMVKNESS